MEQKKKGEIFSGNDVRTYKTYIPYHSISTPLPKGLLCQRKWDCGSTQEEQVKLYALCLSRSHQIVHEHPIPDRTISLFTKCHTLSVTSVQSRHARSKFQHIVVQFNMVLQSIHPYGYLCMHDVLYIRTCLALNQIALHWIHIAFHCST